MSFSKLQRATKDQYTLAEIERALKFKPLLYAYAEMGDLDSIDLIVDAERALQLAKPTATQLKSMQMVWEQGYSLVETGRMLGVTPQAVKFNLGLLQVKLNKVIQEWKASDRETSENREEVTA